MSRTDEKTRIFGRRVVWVIVFNLLALIVVVARLYYLQVYDSAKYKVMSDENRISTRFLVPPRGIIYDRNGEIIAKNEQNFQALLIAEQTPDVQKTLSTFEKIAILTEDELFRIEKNIKQKRRFIPIKLKDNLQWKEVSRILLNAPDLPASPNKGKRPP